MIQPKILDLGCGSKKVEGAIGLDNVKLNGEVDVVHDLNKYPYPFEDEEFDIVYANMILEHLDNLILAMEEIHRILKVDGRLNIKVPYYLSKAAFTDPQHTNFFTENTFQYFTPDSDLNYYTQVRFKEEEVKFFNGNNSFKEKIRNLIPFKYLLKDFLFNIYDEIHFTLIKL